MFICNLPHTPSPIIASSKNMSLESTLIISGISLLTLSFCSLNYNCWPVRKWPRECITNMTSENYPLFPTVLPTVSPSGSTKKDKKCLHEPASRHQLSGGQISASLTLQYNIIWGPWCILIKNPLCAYILLRLKGAETWSQTFTGGSCFSRLMWVQT